MEKLKLALSAEVLPEHMRIMEEYAEVKILPWAGTDYLPKEEEVISECIGHDIVYVYTDPITRRCVEELAENGLKLLGCGRATPNSVDWKALREKNIPLVYTPGRNGHAVAEYTIGLILALCKRIAFTYHGLQNGRFLADEKDINDIPVRKDVIWRFQNRENPRSSYPWSIDVYQRTIGLIGLGAIGQNVSKICKGLGMRVLACDPFQKDEVFQTCGAEKMQEPMELLPLCDFVSVHLNVTGQTDGMIDRTWFEAMRRDAYFINTSRAAVVNQNDLIRALEDGQIAYAALDVMWEEPAPKNHPLLHMENVLITPHMAGISKDVKKWASEMILDEILRFAQGEPNLRVWGKPE
jgi:D-3-phosphoglycerate dehydrogenase